MAAYVENMNVDRAAGDISSMKFVIGVERHGCIACHHYEFSAGTITQIIFTRTLTTWKMYASDHVRLVRVSLYKQGEDGSLDSWDGVRYAFPRPDTGEQEHVDSTPVLTIVMGCYEVEPVMRNFQTFRLGETILHVGEPPAFVSEAIDDNSRAKMISCVVKDSFYY